MAHYQSFTRRYRPQTFGEVCDQKAIITTLKNALALQRVSHAYLFCGPRGVGKTTLARVLAKALNCEHISADFEPCNTCPSCKEITLGQSLDVIEIDGASNRGIDDIRQLNETILYSPSSSRYKIYIIDEVHMLTKEAFNALLKTLEEPPKNVKFFFATTEPHKVLPTILSRCQRFDLHRISLDALEQKLSSIVKELGVSIDPEALYTLAKCADGSLRDAESLLDQTLCTKETHITFSHVASLLGLSSHEVLFSLDKAFDTQDLNKAFELAHTLSKEGKDLLHFVEMLAEHYRRILQHHLGASILKTLPSSYHERYEAAFRIYTKDQCLYLLEYLLEWIHQFHKMSCKSIHLELLLIHVIRSKGRVSIDDLIHTVKALKQESPTESTKPATEINTTPVESTHAIKENLVQELNPILATELPALTTSQVAVSQVTESQVIEPSISTPAITPAALIENSSLQDSEPDQVAPSAEQLQKYETLLRFASVELNGVLKK